MSLGRLGSYEILERIGEGGVGIVFKARDARLNRVVALKVLSAALTADRESRARLLREARAEASLSHPNIATCFEVGEAVPEPPDLLDPGAPGPHPERVYFLAIEYVPGEDLLSMVERKPLPTAQVLDLAVQIASGLEAAHEAGVLHRDLKPGNVRVTPAGQVKILDFGLARIWEAKAAGSGKEPPSFHTSEGRIMGTAAYMAPEQARGEEADARSDLFSFGVLLYQSVTGKLPFTGSSAVEVFYAAASEEPPPLARYASSVPEELERIVQKLLAKRTRDRYQSAHEVLTDLRLLREGRVPSTRSHRRGGRPRRAAVAIVFAAGLGLAAVAALAWWMSFRVLPLRTRSLAVLAFENTTGDSTLDAMGAALAEGLRSGLVQHTGLNVASRAATAGLPRDDRTPKTVAHELGVGAMLTGTIRRQDAGDDLEVELADTRTGFVRWSKQYDLSAGQALRIERDVVQQVASRLGSKADFGAAAGPLGYPTAAVHSYVEYLRGIQELENPDDPLALDRALTRFGIALAQNPEFALSWAGRARALLRIYKRDKQPEALGSAGQAADQAVRLAPDLVEARIARSEILRATGHTNEAIAELKQVVARRPNWDEGCVQLGAAYRDAGKLAEAERWFRQAIALRPDYWRNWNSLGATLLKRGDYAGARAAFEQIVRLVPDKNRGYELLAALDLIVGKPDQAIAEFRRLPTALQDGDLATNIGTAFFYLGQMTQAYDLYALAVRLKPNDAMFRRNLGDLCQHEGRLDEARAAYREAVRLTDQELHQNPRSPNLRMYRALYLAKAGECATASRALAGVGPGLIWTSADFTYSAAMIHSLCGNRAQAIEALRRALELGIPSQKILKDDEFLALRNDPDFRRLTGSRSGAPGPPVTRRSTGSP